MSTSDDFLSVDAAATDASTDPRRPAGLVWGVGAVSTRLGIATPTLRTWERRYGIGPSTRTSGGHRRYAEEDVARVQLMSRLVTRGVPAQAAARVALSLDPDGLSDALASPDGVPGASAAPTPVADDVVASIIEAATALDAVELSRIYSHVFAERGVVDGWGEVVAPALREVGDRWFDGTLGVDAEHLASEMLATEMRALVRGRRPQTMGEPPVVLASAEDEQHSLPLLATEAALAHEGRASYSLGGRLPLQALTDMVHRVRPGAVLLWASLARPVDDPVWASFEGADWPMLVMLGGPGWGRSEPRGLGDAVRVQPMDDLRSAVGAIMELSTPH